jgi:hypothetical protein
MNNAFQGAHDIYLFHSRFHLIFRDTVMLDTLNKISKDKTKQTVRTGNSICRVEGVKTSFSECCVKIQVIF